MEHVSGGIEGGVAHQSLGLPGSVDWTNERIQKVALDTLGTLLIGVGVTFAAVVLAGVIPWPCVFVAIPFLVMGGASIYCELQIQDYDNPQAVEKMKQKAQNMTFLELKKVHGLDNISKHQIVSENLLQEKFAAEFASTPFDQIVRQFPLEEIERCKLASTRFLQEKFNEAKGALPFFEMIESPNLDDILKYNLMDETALKVKIAGQIEGFSSVSELCKEPKLVAVLEKCSHILTEDNFVQLLSIIAEIKKEEEGRSEKCDEIKEIYSGSTDERVEKLNSFLTKERKVYKGQANAADQALIRKREAALKEIDQKLKVWENFSKKREQYVKEKVDAATVAFDERHPEFKDNSWDKRIRDPMLQGEMQYVISAAKSEYNGSNPPPESCSYDDSRILKEREYTQFTLEREQLGKKYDPKIAEVEQRFRDQAQAIRSNAVDAQQKFREEAIQKVNAQAEVEIAVFNPHFQAIKKRLEELFSVTA